MEQVPDGASRFDPSRGETASQVMERAFASYQKDRRFRAIAQSVAMDVMADHGPVDPDDADRDAHDIALTVAVRMLQRIFEEDAELMAMRMERDRYREIAENALLVSPPSIILRDTDGSGQAGKTA